MLVLVYYKKGNSKRKQFEPEQGRNGAVTIFQEDNQSAYIYYKG